LRQNLIAAAATEILTTAHPDDNFPSLGERWAARWLDRHSEFQVQREKSIEIEQQRAMNAAQIQDFFIKYHDAVNNYKIEKCDVWNMDETGLRVGIGHGQWVVVPTGQEQGQFKNLIGSHGDTEHVSIVEAISAGGTVIAPLIIIKGAIIQARWFADIQDNDIAIGVSDSGYSNDILSFQWLQH
jgi:hypothetical protein